MDSNIILATDWGIGIFTIIAILSTIIVGLFALRLVYIDKEYDRIIIEYEKNLMDLNSKLKKPTKAEEVSEEVSEEISDEAKRSVYQRSIGEYKSKRDENSRSGITLDLFILSSIVGFAILAVFGIFESNLLMLNLILILLFIIPVINIYHHLKIIRVQKSLKSNL